MNLNQLHRKLKDLKSEHRRVSSMLHTKNRWVKMGDERDKERAKQVRELLKKREEMCEEITRLTLARNRANTDILETLAKLDELREELKFVESLPTASGPDEDYAPRRGYGCEDDKPVVVREILVVIDEVAAENWRSELRKRIEELDEKRMSFNAAMSITVSP